MFTGIIEGIGKVKRVVSGSESASIQVDLGDLAPGVAIGASVAINGVCLTATSQVGDLVAFDVMPETFRNTTLRDLAPGDSVNLERALEVGGRLDGHIVLGHVDGIGEIIRKQREGTSTVFEVGAPPDILRYIAYKGSITIDGISLTVSRLTESSFEVSIIPHTETFTVLRRRRVGDLVNLEVDVLARYIERLLQAQEPGSSGKGPRGEAAERQGITKELLLSRGFLE